MKVDYSAFFKIISQLTGLSFSSEYKFHPARKWRFDFAIPEYKIAIEIEGGIWLIGRHNRPISMIKDFEKYNEAAKLGWRILKYTPEQVRNVVKVSEDLNIITKNENS